MSAPTQGPPNVTLLTVTYAQPVNASANITLANVNVNVVAALGPGNTIGGKDYESLLQAMLQRGLWSGTRFIPAAWITLITAAQGAM
jgi:hypothetical protein